MADRLAIFYADAFQAGGAPVGIQHLARALSPTTPVSIYGRRSPDELDLGSARRCEYDSVGELPFALARWLKEDQPSLLIVIGFFLPHNPIAMQVASRLGVPTAIHPMSQVADAILTDRVFTHGCDVSDLEQQALNVERTKDRVAARVSPVAKRVFCATAGRYMIAKSRALAVLSEEEGRQIRAMYPRSPSVSISMPWGTDVESIPSESQDHFYRDEMGLDDNRANLVVWCRLDYRFKGLDRAIEGMRWIAEQSDARNSEGELPVRLFLCGPDYRSGVVAARRHIAEAGLENDIFILGPDEYRPGSKKPLRDADATVLLSRWDGSPRTLREAAHYGTPMVVCEETNFADLVRSTSAGAVVDGDDPSSVGRAYLEMADAAIQQRAASGSRELGEQSTWACIGTDLLRQGRSAF